MQDEDIEIRLMKPVTTLRQSEDSKTHFAFTKVPTTTITQIRDTCSDWKDIITPLSILLSGIGLVVTTLYYTSVMRYNQLSRDEQQSRWQREQEQRNEKEAIEKNLQVMQNGRDLLRELESTESRYRMLAEGSYGIGNTGDQTLSHSMELDIPVYTDNTSRGIAYFSLPRAYSLETRTAEREENGETVPFTYTVNVPVGPIRNSVPAPFACTDCNAAYRFRLYFEAVDFERDHRPLATTDYIRLIRAAHDLGRYNEAAEYLAIARNSQDASLDSHLQAKLVEEIGKTYCIMGEVSKGYSTLEKSRSLYRKAGIDLRAASIHDAILWEAQFACTVSDVEHAKQMLEMMSRLLGSYDLGNSQVNKMITHGYASCLLILSEYNLTDPHLEVPKEFVMYLPSNGWYHPNELAMRAKPGQPLPAPMFWAAENYANSLGNSNLNSILEY